MRYPPGHKDETRRAIVAAASRAFRRHGVEGAKVQDIMADAGLTVGGFYRHFESKEELFREALEKAMGETLALLQQRRGTGSSGEEWVRRAAAVYLSPEHRELRGEGCPLPGLTAEVSRREPATRQSFEKILEGMAEEIAHRMSPEAPTETRRRAWGFLATLVGSLLLARGVESPSLAEEILTAGRAGAISK